MLAGVIVRLDALAGWLWQHWMHGWIGFVWPAQDAPFTVHTLEGLERGLVTRKSPAKRSLKCLRLVYSSLFGRDATFQPSTPNEATPGAVQPVPLQVD